MEEFTKYYVKAGDGFTGFFDWHTKEIKGSGR